MVQKLREACLKGLEFLGVEVDKEANKVRGKVREISKPEMQKLKHLLYQLMKN